MNTKEITEHGMGMYRYRGCRCDVCAAAMRVERRKYRKKNDSVDIKLDATPLINMMERWGYTRLVGSQTYAKWKTEGVDLYLADFWCLKFGWHPAEIFGSAFYQGCFDTEEAA